MSKGISLMETVVQKFVPQMDAGKVIIKEVDIEKIFKLTYDHCYVDGRINLQKYEGFTVNLGNPRYRYLDDTRRCKCCHIVTTHAFLEYDFENKNPAGDPINVFNFYAETKDKPESDTSHLVKMTNNEQHGVVCATCGFILAQLRCSIFDVQSILFNAYRAYRSSLTLRLSDETLKPMSGELKKNKKLIEDVTHGLSKVKSEQGKEAMKQKIVVAEARVEELEVMLEDMRTTAQRTGVEVPASVVADLTSKSCGGNIPN
jgi:hypothetical protein